MDHPDAPKLVNSVLKALEVLTRAASSGAQVVGSDGVTKKKDISSARGMEQRPPAVNGSADTESTGAAEAQAQGIDATMQELLPEEEFALEVDDLLPSGSMDNHNETHMEHDMQLNGEALEEVCLASVFEFGHWMSACG